MTSLTESEIKNFKIDLVKNYEGCPDAMLFLKNRYGDQQDDLRKRKEDFMILIHEEKGDWVMNFFLNIMTRKQRLQYIIDRFHENASMIRNLDNYFVDYLQDLQVINSSIDWSKETAAIYEKVYAKRTIVKNELNAESKDNFSSDEFKIKMAESQLIKGLLFFLQDLREKGTLTKSGVRFFHCLSEAKVWNDSARTYTSYLKEEAMQLIDSIEFFNE